MKRANLNDRYANNLGEPNEEIHFDSGAIERSLNASLGAILWYYIYIKGFSETFATAPHFETRT